MSDSERRCKRCEVNADDEPLNAEGYCRECWEEDERAAESRGYPSRPFIAMEPLRCKACGGTCSIFSEVVERRDARVNDLNEHPGDTEDGRHYVCSEQDWWIDCDVNNNHNPGYSVKYEEGVPTIREEA